MSKHTPGPWVIGERVPIARIDNACMIRPADDHNYEHGATAIVGTSEANARLISAAPELLEALEFVIRGVPDTWEGVQKARSAIFKATGETK